MLQKVFTTLAFLVLAGIANAGLVPMAMEVPAPQRFMIERDIPGASRMTPAELQAAAAKSNGVLRSLGPDIQWVHSYVAGDKIYCVYQSPTEALIRLHAERSGIPVSRITPIVRVIDPSTAAGGR